jgi:hypothetical protein
MLFHRYVVLKVVYVKAYVHRRLMVRGGNISYSVQEVSPPYEALAIRNMLLIFWLFPGPNIKSVVYP